MVVDADLVSLLRCPCPHHAEVEYKDRRKAMACQRCGLRFPVRDDIPVMLMDEAFYPGARPAGSRGGVESAPADDGSESTSEDGGTRSS